MTEPGGGAIGRSTLRLGADEARFLAGHLRRLLGWDDRCAVRLVTRGQALAVLGPTPMGVLSFVAVPLATGAGVPDVDAVVSAGRLRDVIGDVSDAARAAPRDVVVPDDMGPVQDLAVWPPDGPWIPAERATAGDVSPLVVAAVERFREEAAGLPAASAEELAQRTWEERTWGGLPLRALHAARSLGFLTRDAARVEAATCAGWKRLSTPAGQLFVRPVGAAARLRLSVVQ